MNEREQSTTNLDLAKQEFVSLLSKLAPGDSKDFLEWIIEQHSLLRSDETQCGHNVFSNVFQQYVNAEQSLQAIIKDLRSRLPLNGVCSSETTLIPEIGQNSDCDPATTVVIDSFLYDDDDVDMLCSSNQFSRYYCRNCGSHSIAPLTLLSHSMSILHLKYIFKQVLPRLIADITNTTLIDIGSRLGAVLFGAYFFSKMQTIIGVEINRELFQIQNEMIQKYGLGNRVKTVCDDVRNVGELLKQADVIVLNNAFEFFLQRDVQINTWQNIRQNICKPGCVLVTVPTLEESVCIGGGGQPILDISSWLVRLNVNASELGMEYSVEELDELSNINFYKVK